jgi:Rod binding domain-containing protein
MPSLSAKINPNATIDKSAQDFEAMFATQMLQPMFEGVGVDPTFGGGHGEEVMKSFMLQEYGKIIAKTGKLGIAHQVKSEMLRIQEDERKRNGVSTSQAVNAYAAPLSPSSGGSHVTH